MRRPDERDDGTASDDSGRGSAGPGLTPAARRALAEAEARRRTAAAQAAPTEVDGRGGLEPVRYGDWEVKGLALDF